MTTITEEDRAKAREIVEACLGPRYKTGLEAQIGRGLDQFESAIAQLRADFREAFVTGLRPGRKCPFTNGEVAAVEQQTELAKARAQIESLTAQLATQRDAALEEAAHLCDLIADDYKAVDNDIPETIARYCGQAIRKQLIGTPVERNKSAHLE